MWKLIKKHKALHLIEHIDRLYVSRKEGGGGLANTQNSFEPSIQKLEEFMKNAEEYWLQPPETEATETPIEQNSQKTHKYTHTNKWKKTQLHRYFKQLTIEFLHKETWT